MYEVVVSFDVYSEWDCYYKWIGLPAWVGHFNEWVVEIYPEIVSVEWDYGNRLLDLIFTFTSENHYHWFLLRQ